MNTAARVATIINKAAKTGVASSIIGSFTVSDQSPAPGDTVTFTLTLTSTPVGSYSLQLTRNGVNVSGATSSPHQITNWQEANDGAYRWVVVDSGNSDTRTFGPRTVTAVVPLSGVLSYNDAELSYNDAVMSYEA